MSTVGHRRAVVNDYVLIIHRQTPMSLLRRRYQDNSNVDITIRIDLVFNVSVEPGGLKYSDECTGRRSGIAIILATSAVHPVKC